MDPTEEYRYEKLWIDDLITSFTAQKGNYDLIRYPENPVAQKVFINLNKYNADSKTEFDIKTIMTSEATNFVVNRYIGTNENTLNILKITIELFTYLTDKYLTANAVAMRASGYHVHDKSIILVPKGGILLKMIFDALKTKNVTLNNFVYENYKAYFGKSDLDFSIYIDNAMPDALFDTVFSDLTVLCYYVMYIVRENIEKNSTDYFAYDTYSEETKLGLLKKMKNNVNESLKKKYALRCCKLIHQDIVKKFREALFFL